MARLSSRGAATAAGPGVRRRRAAALLGWWPLAPVLLGVTLLALPTLAFPFGPDQSIFAVIGQAINQGGMPYVDAWDQKPPGIYLLYALALQLPGPLMARVRLFDLLWTLATLVAVYALARRLWNVRAGVFAALLYGGVYFTTQGWWYLAQPDGWLNLPLLLMLLLTLRGLRGGGAGWWLVGAGAALGVAATLRFTIVLPALALVLLDRRERPGPWAATARRAGWFAAGCFAVLALLAGWLAVGGALDDFLAATRFAAGYTRLGWPDAPQDRDFDDFLQHLRGSFQLFAVQHLALVLPAGGAAVGAFVTRGDWRARVVMLLTLLVYVGLVAQQKFFWYHWQQLLGLLALLGGRGWDSLFAWVERQRPRAPAAGQAAIVAALLLVTPALTDFGYAQWDAFLHRNDSYAARLRYDNQFGPFGGGTFSYLADVQVADYLRARTRPGESIAIFGYDPLILLLAERPSASRFIYTLPLMSHWAPAAWLDEYAADLDRARPVYLIVQRYEGAAPWITGQAADTFAWAWRLSPIADRLTRDYDEEIEIEDFVLYRRRDTGDPP